MNDLKIRIVIDSYTSKLSEMGFKPIEAPDDSSNNSSRVDVEHCMWMMEKIKVFLENGDLDRAYRWFGFVQGCLWCCGVFTISEMKSYNKAFIDSAVA